MRRPDGTLDLSMEAHMEICPICQQKNMEAIERAKQRDREIPDPRYRTNEPTDSHCGGIG